MALPQFILLGMKLVNTNYESKWIKNQVLNPSYVVSFDKNFVFAFFFFLFGFKSCNIINEIRYQSWSKEKIGIIFHIYGHNDLLES